MEKYKNKYRIESARLKNWNYGNAALYFITICTQDRLHYFGEIIKGVDTLPCVSLSPIGKIVQAEWLKTFELRKDMNLQMGEFVVMPNHFHAVIGIGESTNAIHCVSTGDVGNKFGPQSKNLASIVRGFKSAVTVYARKSGIDFQWQPRFHDHIIRTDDSFNRISNYIINNPAKWQEDKFFDIK